MRILIIEDEIKLNQAIKRALEVKMYAVDAAFDGQTGLDLAIGEKYDLIIVDWMLPEIDGIGVCRGIRDQSITTPIIMLTAKGQTSDKIDGLDSGADDYLTKPFSLEELFARIRALIRRASKQTSPILRVGDISLDPVAYQVLKGEDSISLSSKEFAILEYLLRNKGTIVSKEQIIQSVWDYNADILPGTIEVHVKHIRDKIDTPFHTTHLKTIRGFGYKIS